MTNAIRAMLVSLLLIFAPGCMTRGLWEQASATTMHPHSLQGFVADSTGKSTKGLLIGYEPDNAHYHHFSGETSVFIPTDATGLPLAPYRCDGENPGKQQIRAVEIIGFKNEDYVLGERLRTSTNFCKIHPGDGNRWFVQSLATSPHWGSITLITIGKTPALPVGHPGSESAVELLLPSSVPRPEADVRADQVRAAFLTPLTAVGDAASVPLALGGWFWWAFVTGDN